MSIPNYHILEVRYLNPTNSRGARVSIKSARFKQSVIINFDYAENSIADMAVNHLRSAGFDIIGIGESVEGYYLISDSFEPIKGGKS
jgi:hypothetical protein